MFSAYSLCSTSFQYIAIQLYMLGIFFRSADCVSSELCNIQGEAH